MSKRSYQQITTLNICLFFIFRLDQSDIPKMCSHNAAAAVAVGRKDLAQVTHLNYLLMITTFS